MLAILINVSFRSAASIRGKRLFQCEYPKVLLLLEGGGVYLSLGAPRSCFAFAKRWIYLREGLGDRGCLYAEKYDSRVI